MASVKTIEAGPRASILIESMRDVGYTLETSLADVIDNSISARATEIGIHVDTVSPEVRIGIVDNGHGMTGAELIEAMRLGSRHPGEQRDPHDLGRFGLGLKTASFSQCRRLTVVVRKSGETAAAVWDLDHVAATDSWSLQLLSSAESVPFLDELGDEGALVVWEHIDRAVEQESTEAGRRNFVRRIDDARAHLELVFHRYLSGEAGVPRVQILLNRVPLEPYDPFNARHSATIRGATERVMVGDSVVEITPFTLPHHRNVTRLEWDLCAGPDGYLRNQGFYLYRERRLIVHGTWFGLARQMELTKLTRVRVDMPCSLDAEWHVDVKKASARPPLQVRERLRSIIDAIGAPSKKIYTHRGAVLHDSRLQIWQRLQKDNEIVYRINAEHHSIRSFRDVLPDDRQGEFSRVLQAVGAGLPLDAIFADLAGTPECVKSDDMSDDDLRALLDATIVSLLASNTSKTLIPDMLRVVEPFRSAWDRTEELLETTALLREAEDD